MSEPRCKNCGHAKALHENVTPVSGVSMNCNEIDADGPCFCPGYASNRTGFMMTQVVLTQDNTEKVYWFVWVDLLDNRFLVGDRLTLLEESGVWVVSRACLSLEDKNVVVPHRVGTLRSLVRTSEEGRYRENYSKSRICD